jgi:N-acetylglucosamine-6-phosphate deacetylase
VRGYWGRTEKGRIALGADAELVVLAPEGTVQETIVGGESVYRREEGL